MKTSNKFFFLILFSFLILIPFSSISPYVVGETNEPMISTDLLSVQLGSFQDNTPNDGSGKIDYITGGFDLISFENLGQYGVDLETNTIIYRAQVVWGYEINAWTSALFRNIYPFIKIDNIEEVPFLSIQYWRHIGLCALPVGSDQTSHPQYKIKFFDIDYGTTTKTYGYDFSTGEVDVPGSYLQHDYHGYIPVAVGIDSGLAYSGKINIGDNSFTVPELVSDILYTKVVDMRGGECGSYTDRYTNEGMSSASVTVDVPEGTWSSNTQTLTNWFNNEKVGTISQMSNSTLTIQQSVYDLSYKGLTLHASDSSNILNFNLPVHIQPEVTKVRNYFNLKTGGFQWYSCCGKYKRSPWTVDKRIIRDLSVYVQNVFAHYGLEMKSELFMTCQFSGKLSQEILDDPNLVISDMIWDKSIWGDESVHIKLPKEKEWWEDILWIIIIIALVYIAYKLISKYLNLKSGGLNVRN